MNGRNFKILYYCIAILAIAGCQTDLQWKVEILDSGTYSSPRAIDLNNDNIEDVVIGAGGKEEWDPSGNGVIALNGKNGKLLWRVPCRNQMVGSALFHDIDKDGTSDVIIGGRSAQLLAINGTSGDLLWEYLKDDGSIDFKNDTSVLNFFNPQLIPDQDNDSVQDILVAYGGFVKAAPYDEYRPAGYLMLISSRDGSTISKAAMPDGNETYMSPVIFYKGDQLNVLFGSGGETLPGKFYITPLSDLLDQKIEEYSILAEGMDKGFIAPPVIADLNQDAIKDIIVSGYDGSTYAFDGSDLSIFWKADFGTDFETHSQPGIGYIDQDSVPDFFLNLGKGSWPHIESSWQVIIDGATGQWEKLHQKGILQYSSPVSYFDFASGKTGFLLQVNDKFPTNYSSESGMPAYSYKTSLYSFIDGTENLINTRDGINIGSTVLLSDLDKNRKNEIIMVYNRINKDPFTHQGMVVECIPNIAGEGLWTQYMGALGKSWFKPYKSGQ